MKNGSFNVCFFVEFYTVATKWVVRIPIEPVVHRAWEKLQSEVYTMQYVRAHTNVPVPQVYAYGRASLRHDNLKEQSCYMMMEHAAGQPLNAEFFKSPPERRQYFFADLINILAELRGQWLSSDHDLALHVAQIFQNPYWLDEDFSKLIYPHLSDRPMDDAIREFFLSQQRQDELKQRVQNSERYARYLMENNLYKLSDLQQWIAEGQALMARLKEKDG